MDSYPAVEVYLHVESEGLDIDQIEKLSQLAMPLCLEHPGTEEPVLSQLKMVEVSLVSDEVISQVHGEFMDDPTATDVITFHHGELLVSFDTAKRAGPEHGHSLLEEVMLYLIHGLLHLNGHTDLSEPERTEMHRIQDAILAQVLKG